MATFEKPHGTQTAHREQKHSTHETKEREAHAQSRRACRAYIPSVEEARTTQYESLEAPAVSSLALQVISDGCSAVFRFEAFGHGTTLAPFH